MINEQLTDLIQALTALEVLPNMELHSNNIEYTLGKIRNELEIGFNNIDNTLIRIADALEIIAKK